MVLTLALLEIGSLFVVVFGMLVVWAQPLVSTWSDVAIAVAQSLTFTVCCVLCFYYNDLYDFRVVRTLGEFVPRLVKSILLALGILLVFSIVLPNQAVGGGRFLVSLLIVAALLMSVRTLCYGVMAGHFLAERVLILGTGPLARTIAHLMQAAPRLGYSVVALVDDGKSGGPSQPGEMRLPNGRQAFVYGTLEEVDEAIKAYKPNRIVVALSERRGRLPLRELLASSLNGVVVEDGIEAFERLTGKLAIESIAPSDIVFSQHFRKERLQLAMARAVSLIVALGGIILLLPLLILVALAIKLDSPGSIFFVQRRLGLRNRSFELFKFRTMRPSESTTTEWAKDNQHRITRVGAWLRKYRFDELPQLANVVKGDMNLVGPRPHPVTNHELFLENISYYPVRALVRPGITGWAQVRYGYADDLEQEMEKMRFDLYYIKHMSLWFDVRILVDTVKIVLFGHERVWTPNILRMPSPAPSKPLLRRLS